MGVGNKGGRRPCSLDVGPQWEGGAPAAPGTLAFFCSRCRICVLWGFCSRAGNLQIAICQGRGHIQGDSPFLTGPHLCNSPWALHVWLTSVGTRPTLHSPPLTTCSVWIHAAPTERWFWGIGHASLCLLLSWRRCWAALPPQVTLGLRILGLTCASACPWEEARPCTPCPAPLDAHEVPCAD